MQNNITLSLILLMSLLAGCQHHAKDAAGTTPRAGAGPASSAADDQPYRLESFEAFIKRVPTLGEAERLLSKPVSLKTDNLTLRALIEFVRVQTDANITTNWAALELVGIDRDSLVTVQVNDMPAWKLLHLALDQVSADAFDDDKAGYRSADGVISISTLRELKRHTVTRIYDVGWYVNMDLSTMYQLYDKPTKTPKKPIIEDRPPAEQSPPEANRTSPTAHAWLCNANTSVDPFDGNGAAMEYTLSRQFLIDQVIELIMTTAGDYDDWMDNQSTITEINHVLIIKATPKQHETIAALLTALYESRVEHFERRARFREAVKLLKEAEALRMEQDYKPALKRIDQALRVSPGYPEALILRKIILGAMGSR